MLYSSPAKAVFWRRNDKTSDCTMPTSTSRMFMISEMFCSEPTPTIGRTRNCGTWAPKTPAMSAAIRI